MPSVPPPPPAPEEAATQFLPPVGGAPDEAATQLIPPVGGAPDEAATQLIPPVDDGGPLEATAQIRALPLQATPERPDRAPGNRAPGADPEGATQLIPPVAADPEATTQLRAVAPGRASGGRGRGPRPCGAQPVPPGPGRPAAGGPAGGDFENLFRSAAEPAGGRPGGPGLPPPPYGGDGPARRRSPLLIVAAVVLGCAVIGLGAGALLGGGDGGGSDTETSQSAAAGDSEQPGDGETGADGGETPQDEGQDEAGDEEARAQAEALSALLDQSNDSRDAVVGAVADVRSCKHLGRAAQDLRAARDQRNGLVTQLNSLELDALPDGEALGQALVEAWQSSAQADENYAAWAEEAANNRDLCHGGQLRRTDRADQGDAASQQATEAKQHAAELWNPVARQYGLPERDPGQL
ncbi:hypothetical protein [Streptomyces hoynatensis]|nr:hypothetical protein [Streptomyces hoynatensis]